MDVMILDVLDTQHSDITSTFPRMAVRFENQWKDNLFIPLPYK